MTTSDPKEPRAPKSSRSGPEEQPRLSAFDRRAVLRNHPIFGALDAKVIDRLSAFAKTQRAKRGETIFVKGDPGTGLFAVHSGTVKIAIASPDGRDAVFNLIGEGGVFGEIALLDGHERTADAIALTDCELMVIDRRDFLSVVRSQPDAALKVIEVLCARLRRTSEHVEEVMFVALPGRLAKALLRLAQASAGGRDVAITQREIGQIIGMSRESTNKQLRSWEERNWVKLRRGGVTILAPQELAAIAEDDPTSAERTAPRDAGLKKTSPHE